MGLEDQIFEETKKIAIPRMVGSQGEHKILEFLKERMEKSKYQPHGDTFHYNLGYFKLKEQVFRFLSIFCIINFLFLVSILFSSLSIPQIRDLLLISSILFSIGVGTKILFILLKISKLEFTETNEEDPISTNIYCEKKSDRLQPFVLIIVMAHYDSISYNSSYKQMKKNILRAAVSLLIGVGIHISLIFSGFTNFIFYNQSEFYFTMIFIIVGGISYIICFIYINCLNKVKYANNSPGAIDNSSGVSILLNIIRNFEKITLNWCDIRFLFPSAEEFGLFGSKAHVDIHKAELDKYIKVYAINIDSITAPFCYQAFLSKKENPNNLKEIIESTALNSKIHVRKSKIMLGGGDHLVFSREGFESVCFFGKTFDFIHSPSDRIDKVDKKTLLQCSELIYRTILEIDRRTSFVIESGSKKLK